MCCDCRLNDAKEGYGEYYFLDGTHYVGQFRGDMINGKGAMYFQDKSQFNGTC